MKKIIILVLFVSTCAFAQKQISLKDLGTIDFDKTNDEISDLNDRKVYSGFQRDQNKAAETK
jgi:hypothetical protein